MTARAASLLPTVRSRSQRVRFGAVPQARLEAWLVARGLDPRLAATSLGSPGLALRLSQGESEERRESMEALLGAVGQPLHRLFAFTEQAGKKSEAGGAELVLDAVEELLRDVVMVAAGRESAVLHADRLVLLRRWALAMMPGGVARMDRAVSAGRDRLRLNVNGRIVLEALISTLNLELSQVRLP